MQRLRFSLTYANVISTLALFLVLGGGAAFAANNLAKNSVGSKQLKKSAVTTAKLKKEAVTAAKVKMGALTGAQINVSTLGTVPSANQANSSNHANSADNASHAITADSTKALARVSYRENTSAGPVTVPPCSSNPCTPDNVGTAFAIATCPAGMVAIGGGGVTADSGVELAGSFPTSFGGGSENAWEVDVDNYLQSNSSVEYFVVCTAAAAVE